MSSSLCLHVLTTSTKLCDRCRAVVPGAARPAARLRGRHNFGTSTTLINSRGVTKIRVVRGDEVGEVEVTVRERRPDEIAVTTDLVAEVTKGDLDIAVGMIFPVAAAKPSL